MGVVEPFEVVQIEQGDAQRRAAPVGGCDLARQRFVQAAPVQAAGQLVFSHQFAHLHQLRFPRLHARFGFLHFLARVDHLVACLERIVLRGAGFSHDVVEHRIQIADIGRGADFF